MVSYKGKEVAGKDSSGKRRRGGDPEKAGGGKRRNRGVVQFCDDAAYAVDEDDVSDLSDFEDWDFFEDEFKTQGKANNEPGKAHNIPLFPKEEELSEEELEKMLEERYKPGSSFMTYADDVFDSKRSVDGKAMPSFKEPTIWKVKCMVGRERQSAFCLMQKYENLNALGTKLQIISAFSLDHVKGFIYIEAERQSDINEACKGLCTIYASRLAPVPKNEVLDMFSVQSKGNEVSVGSWARVKSGKYKGDLAQVIAVNDSRKKATVKLIPRIDLQALAGKYGGGIASKKTAIPAPRLITSTELEEFRPLIQYRRDRETGLAFDVFDGMMLKDGYLYKKVSIDSLSLWGVMPSEDELLKFESAKKEEPDCQEWLTELYGEKKKERVVKSDKGGGKGEGSSSSSMETSFEVHDLVLFNRKDFGVIVGSEKDGYYKILKEGSEGPVVVTIDVRQLKKASFENKFTALDHRKKTISINDTVRVLEGPLEGRQGNVKHIYRGTIFLHDEVEQENSGYFCCKSQICEKITFSDDACKAKGGESAFTVFDDIPSSPKSPLSPEKPWEKRERNSNFNREDKDGMFSIGQVLRIRVGPLKGYLCRVLAIRRSDVTVKLDSQHKILTVKSEHLSEVRGKSSGIPMGDDKEPAKPFDLLGNPDGSTDWMKGPGTSADGERWGAGGLTTERSSWPAFPSSGTLAKPESNTADPDTGGGGWGNKATLKQNSSWGNAAADEKPLVKNDQAGGWGSGGGNWGKAKISSEDHTGSSQDAGGNWGLKPKTGSSNDTATWGKKDNNEGLKQPEEPRESPLDSWGKAAENRSTGDGSDSSKGWGDSVAEPTTQTVGWGKTASVDGGQAESWGKTNRKKDDSAPGWGKTSNVDGGQAENWGKTNIQKDDSAPGWGKTSNVDGGLAGNWGKTNIQNNDSGPGWGKTSNADGGLAGNWGKTNVEKNDNAPGWGKTSNANGGQAGNWGKTSVRKDDSAPGWGKTSNADGGQAGSWGATNVKIDHSSTPAQEGQAGGWGSGGGSSWNNKQGGGSWNKQDAGSSWGKKSDQQESWDGNKSFDGGRGSGGRRGGRGGDRDNFEEGRSFGGSQPCSWSKGGQDSRGKGKEDGGNDGSSWNSSVGATGNQAGGWGNNAGVGKLAQSQGDTGGWNKSTVADGVQTESWGSKKKDGGGATGLGGGGSSWGKAADSEDRGKAGERWGSKDGGSSWNKQDGGFSWGKQNDGNIEDVSKGTTDCSKPLGGDRGYGGWNKDSADQQDTFDGGYGSGGRRGRGGWRGGRVGRSFGGESQDNEGTERGGFGGRGWSDRGGRGGGGYERGGFRGRGRSDRGGFGGRGRGRRDENSEWGSQNDGGSSWKSSNDGGSSWKGSNDGGDKGQSWGSSWNSSTGTATVSGGAGGWNKENGSGGRSSGTWNKSSPAEGGQSSGLGTSKEITGARPGSVWSKGDGFGDGGSAGTWNKQASGEGGQSSGWGAPKDTKGACPGSSWNKGIGMGDGGSAGTWNKPGLADGGQPSILGTPPKDAKEASPGFGWNKGNGSGDGGSAGTWNKPGPADGGQSSGWGAPKDVKGASDDGGSADAWGKPAASPSWGKGNGGGNKGGW